MRVAVLSALAALAVSAAPVDARPCDSYHGSHHGNRWRDAHAHRVATISSRARHRLSHRRHAIARRHYAGLRYGYRYGHGSTFRYGYARHRYGYAHYGRRAYLVSRSRYPRYVSYRYRYGYRGTVRPYVRPLALAPFVMRFATALTLDDERFDGDVDTSQETPSYDGLPHERVKPVGSRFLVGP